MPIGGNRCKKVLNQVSNPGVDHSWIPSSVWQCSHFRQQQALAPKEVDCLGDVPVMSATVLGLDLLLQEPYIDLRIVSELVLSDVGATIQVLRLIGSEYEFSGERPSRMDECLASLEVGAWFGVVSARTFACDQEHAAITAVWKHCRLVAQYAQLVAESLDGISSEEAYLVGLLHEVHAIPNILNSQNYTAEATDRSTLSAMEGALPQFVLAALDSVNDSSPSSTWRFILSAAHDLAGVKTDFDVSTLLDISSTGIS
jgi:hypothetical protein